MTRVVVELRDRQSIRVIWSPFGLLTFADKGCLGLGAFDSPRVGMLSNTPALPFVHDSSDNLGFSPEEEQHGAHSYARDQDRS